MPSYPTAAGTGNPRIRCHVPRPFHPASFPPSTPCSTISRIPDIVVVIVVVVVVGDTVTALFDVVTDSLEKSAFLFRRVARAAIGNVIFRSRASASTSGKGSSSGKFDMCSSAGKCSFRTNLRRLGAWKLRAKYAVCKYRISVPRLDSASLLAVALKEIGRI